LETYLPRAFHASRENGHIPSLDFDRRATLRGDCYPALQNQAGFLGRISPVTDEYQQLQNKVGQRTCQGNVDGWQSQVGQDFAFVLKASSGALLTCDERFSTQHDHPQQLMQHTKTLIDIVVTATHTRTITKKKSFLLMAKHKKPAAPKGMSKSAKKALKRLPKVVQRSSVS
jgi:hypothetical protein